MRPSPRPLAQLLALATLLGGVAGVEAQGFWRIPLFEPSDGYFLFDPPVGRWMATAHDFKIVAVADFNADGLMDFTVGGHATGVAVHLNRGALPFIVSWEYVPPGPPSVIGVTSGLAAGDFDQDGDQDLILGRFDPAGQSTPPCLLFRNDGQGQFSAAPPGALPASAANVLAVATGDVDLDGDIDLVMSQLGNPLPTRFLLLLNDGTGRFSDVSANMPSIPAVEAYRLLLTDLNHDGLPDIVAACGGSHVPNPNLVLLNQGMGRFSPSSFDPRLAGSAGVACGDLNGDGHPDLVFAAATTTSSMRMYFGDGQGNFTDVSTQLPYVYLPAAIFDVAILDFDRDGQEDLVWSTTAPPGDNLRLRWFRNRGQGWFEDRTIPIAQRQYVDPLFEWLLATDIDVDGDVDLLGYGGAYLPPLGAPMVGVFLLANLQRHIYTQDRLLLGLTHKLELFADPGHIVVPALASRGALTPVGPLGFLGLDPATLLVLPAVTSPNTRRTVLMLPVPNDPGLRGTEVWSQALDLDPAAPNGARLTNWRRDTIQ